MASPESMKNHSFFSHDDDCDDTDDGYVYGYGYGCGYELQQQNPHNLSRLSMCTLNSMSLDEDEDEANGVGTSMMSIESFDGDADEELSDDKEGKEELGGLSSDSDKEPGCYSLPATPPRRRNLGGLLKVIGVKEYASENEAQKNTLKQRMRRRRGAKVLREKREARTWDKRKKKEEEGYGSVTGGGGGFNSFSGESEGAGLVVITRPKGGRRSLCMDLEEVKACRDLGFELEHERMLEMPTRISISGSTTLDTSSGGNSPIASWRISSPGDDPRDVKARLKVWAQAVALASTSRQSS